MKKIDLVASVAATTGVTQKAAATFVNAFMESIHEELTAGGKVQILGFGSFSVRSRKERLGRNPQTGQSIDIPAGKVPVFLAGKELKDVVNAE